MRFRHKIARSILISSGSWPNAWEQQRSRWRRAICHSSRIRRRSLTWSCKPPSAGVCVLQNKIADDRKRTEQDRSAGQLVQLHGQGEAETSAAVDRSILGFKLSTKRFNDGAGNGQTQSHAGILGCEEAIKEMFEMLWLDAGAAVIERAAQALRIGKRGSNSKIPASSFH